MLHQIKKKKAGDRYGYECIENTGIVIEGLQLFAGLFRDCRISTNCGPRVAGTPARRNGVIRDTRES